jgi:hypothetical protein
MERRVTLTDLRKRLLDALDEAEDPRALATLSKELRAVMAEIDSLPGGEEADPVDDLAAQRAARLARAAGQ